MKDSDIRGLILQKFYEHRDDDDGPFQPSPEDFDGQVSESQILRIGEQLQQQGLIEGQIVRTLGGGGVVFARITAFGSDVIEGTRESPIALHIGNNSINISNSTGVSGIVAGNNNQQTITQAINDLARIVDAADGTPKQKHGRLGRPAFLGTIC